MPPLKPSSDQEFRAALGMFPTGVAIITTISDTGCPVGLTANSFNSVSLEPPLVAWSLSNKSRSRHVFEQAGHFAVNVLSLEQRSLAERFAVKVTDPFLETDWFPGVGSVPVIPDAAAVFECSIRDRYAGGDHMIYLGEVKRFSYKSGNLPLIFSRGRFCHEPQPA